MKREEDSLLVQMSPVLGASIGAAAATMGAEMLLPPKFVPWAPWGTAALGFLTAMNTTGLVRGVATGVAAAGASIAVLRLIGAASQGATAVAAVTTASAPEQQRQAAPSDAVTRADLEIALAALAAKHQADLAERESTHVVQLRELQTTVHTLLEKLREADVVIASMRAGGGTQPMRGNAELSSGGGPPSIDTMPAPIEQSRGASPTHEGSQVAKSPAALATAVDSQSLSTEEVARFEAIYGLLDEQERRQLSALVANLPKDALAKAQAQLLQLKPHQAVAYLRRKIFPSMRAQA
jgi:hypothetical protein